ncbi:hypothetical protein F5882DRAFT_523095 [Hyaloscypha sp. PMI_1271]|nr:hypothetical protein F5882DRAFT_523095 [Hyaloscypha sp. PMI_1271]
MDGALELWETGGFHASWAALEAAEYDLCLRQCQWQMEASRIHNNRQIVLGMPMITVSVVQLIYAGQACYTGPNWREQFYKTRHEVFDRITLGLMTEDEIPVTMQKKWAATSKIPGGWVVFAFCYGCRDTFSSPAQHRNPHRRRRAPLLKVRTPPQSPLASAVQSTVLRSVQEAPQIEDIPIMTTNTTDLEDTTASAYPFLGHLMPSHTWRDIAEVSTSRQVDYTLGNSTNSATPQF